ncbi:MAG: hypothetical protein WD740_05240 [Anaerolineales bacterium]
MADLEQSKLADLLRNAQAAHHDFKSMELGGSRDEQWCTWYAQYLLDNGLAGLIASEPDSDRLAALLERSSQDHKTASGEEDWATFSAHLLLENLPDS